MWRSTRHQRSPSRAENQAAVGGLSANCWRIIRLSASRVPCCAGGAQPMPDCYEVETWTRIPLRSSSLDNHLTDLCAGRITFLQIRRIEMSLVRVRKKYQVTLPASVRRKAGVA